MACRAGKLVIIITAAICLAFFIFTLIKREEYLEDWQKVLEARKLMIDERITGERSGNKKEIIKQTTTNDKKLWFLKDGTVLPTKGEINPNKLFPSEFSNSDRIVEQLMYIPEDYDELNSQEKVILVPQGVKKWGQHEGAEVFAECPVNKCRLTGDDGQTSTADALLFKDSMSSAPEVKMPHQIWIMYMLECPYHTARFDAANLINWTATYRTDSDIVAPYAKFVYYDNRIKQRLQPRNYLANKTKQVAWFVSNCNARNNRLQYARDLSNHIPVDIFGACGTKSCPRRNDQTCYNMLEDDYKFYLAFENSNCHDYITEKFYGNSLEHDVVPIVMGAPRTDYERSAPMNSFIHVDDFSGVEELAEFLKRLGENEDEYNVYFQWKGTGEFVNTYFWCRLCAMMHAPHGSKFYKSYGEWWGGHGVCT